MKLTDDIVISIQLNNLIRAIQNSGHVPPRECDRIAEQLIEILNNQ